MGGGEFVHVENFTVGRFPSVELLAVVGRNADLIGIGRRDVLWVHGMRRLCWLHDGRWL